MWAMVTRETSALYTSTTTGLRPIVRPATLGPVGMRSKHETLPHVMRHRDMTLCCVSPDIRPHADRTVTPGSSLPASTAEAAAQVMSACAYRQLTPWFSRGPAVAKRRQGRRLDLRELRASKIKVNPATRVFT